MVLCAGSGSPTGIGKGDGVFECASHVLSLENCCIDVPLLHLLVKCAIWHFKHIGPAGAAVVGLGEVLEKIPSNQHHDHDEDRADQDRCACIARASSIATISPIAWPLRSPRPLVVRGILVHIYSLSVHLVQTCFL